MELSMYTELILELVSINKQLGDRGVLLLTYNARDSKFAIMTHLDDGAQFRTTDKYLTICISETKRKLVRAGYLPKEAGIDVLYLVAEAVRYCPELSDYFNKLKEEIGD